MVDRQSVHAQGNAGGAGRAATPGPFLRWPDHALVGFGQLRGRYRHGPAGALCASTLAAPLSVGFQHALVSAARAHAPVVRPHFHPPSTDCWTDLGVCSIYSAGAVRAGDHRSGESTRRGLSGARGGSICVSDQALGTRTGPQRLTLAVLMSLCDRGFQKPRHVDAEL